MGSPVMSLSERENNKNNKIINVLYKMKWGICREDDQSGGEREGI